jgi:hypothetical protein
MMAGSLLGGAASDRAAAASPGVVSARGVPSILGSLALPAGALVFGFVLGAGGPLLLSLFAFVACTAAFLLAAGVSSSRSGAAGSAEPRSRLARAASIICQRLPN